MALLFLGAQGSPLVLVFVLVEQRVKLVERFRQVEQLKQILAKRVVLDFELAEEGLSLELEEVLKVLVLKMVFLLMLR